MLPFLNNEGALKLPKRFFFGFFISAEGTSGEDTLAPTSGVYKGDSDRTARATAWARERHNENEGGE